MYYKICMKNLCESCILCCALLGFTVIVEILPIQRKIPYNQSINQSINQTLLVVAVRILSKGNINTFQGISMYKLHTILSEWPTIPGTIYEVLPSAKFDWLIVWCFRFIGSISTITVHVSASKGQQRMQDLHKFFIQIL